LARRRSVQTVPAPDESREVLRGLQAGESLIVAGTTKVAEGRAIQVQTATAATSAASAASAASR